MSFEKTTYGSPSGVGAQSAAPGPSRKCHSLERTVKLYLWRHRAQSTTAWSFVFWRPLAKTFDKFRVNA